MRSARRPSSTRECPAIPCPRAQRSRARGPRRAAVDAGTADAAQKADANGRRPLRGPVHGHNVEPSKERLVEHPRHWPGVHCVDALLGGAPLVGVWVDRTLRYRADRNRQMLEPGAEETREVLVLTPLPCWAHLSEDERRQRVAAMVEEIIAVGRAERRGRAVLGRERILKQSPHQRPSSSDHSPAPLVHAASKAMRIAMKAAYNAFLAAFRAAADQLRAGVRNVVFPRGCFPPALPAISLRPG